VASGDAHTRDSIRSMLLSFELVRSRFTHIAAGPRTLSTDDTVQFVSLTHIVANRGAGEHNYG